MKKLSDEKYSLPMRVMHWLSAIIILSLIAVGWWMTGLDKDVEYRGTVYSLHKSFGMLILLLVALRLIIRLRSKVPPLPETMPKMVKRGAHGAHYLLYGLMFAIPIAGYVMSNAFGYSVHLFSIELPKLFPTNRDLGDIAHEAHEILAYSLLAVIVLHVAGALKHRYFDKPEHDVLKRMWLK